VLILAFGIEEAL